MQRYALKVAWRGVSCTFTRADGLPAVPARKPAALLLRQLRRNLVEAGEDIFRALRIRVPLPNALQRVLTRLGAHRPHRVVDQGEPGAEISEISS